MPPSHLLSGDPLLLGDYPLHTHRIHVYRNALKESGLPWGCDPAVCAGLVMSPTEDIGAKPLQIIGTALPFVSEARIILWLAFLGVVCLPVGVLMACRSLRLPAAALNGALVSLLFLFWTNPNLALAFRWGMISFTAANFSQGHRGYVPVLRRAGPNARLGALLLPCGAVRASSARAPYDRRPFRRVAVPPRRPDAEVESPRRGPRHGCRSGRLVLAHPLLRRLLARAGVMGRSRSAGARP